MSSDSKNGSINTVSKSLTWKVFIRTISVCKRLPLLTTILNTVWFLNNYIHHDLRLPFHQTASRECFEFDNNYRDCVSTFTLPKRERWVQLWDVVKSSILVRAAGWAEELSALLLIVSSVLAKSAGCDSRPLSWYLLTTGLGILSSHLPYHRLHHYHYLSLHSHLNVFAAGMRISTSVSKKRCKLTTTDCRLTSVGSGCWLWFVSFW